MPTEIVGSLPQLAAVVEKLGVIGVLLIAVAWLAYERVRLVRQGQRTFRQRDKCRLIAERYRGALVAHGTPVPDITDIQALYSEDKED